MRWTKLGLVGCSGRGKGPWGCFSPDVGGEELRLLLVVPPLPHSQFPAHRLFLFCCERQFPWAPHESTGQGARAGSQRHQDRDEQDTREEEKRGSRERVDMGCGGTGREKDRENRNRKELGERWEEAQGGAGGTGGG